MTSSSDPIYDQVWDELWARTKTGGGLAAAWWAEEALNRLNPVFSAYISVRGFTWNTLPEYKEELKDYFKARLLLKKCIWAAKKQLKGAS